MSTDTIRLVVSRQFDAPPEAAFDAWLDAESVAQWLFRTPGSVIEHVSIAPRVGGGFEVFERRGATLAQHFGAYVALDRPHLLAFDFRTGPDEPATRVTLAFEARDGGCLVTLTHDMDAAWAAYAERAKAGWSGILDQLAQALAGEARESREITQVREYDAPRSLVWEAWTKPEHVDRWWGPNDFTNRTELMELRPDGRWRYTMTGPDGTIYPNFVLFMDIAPEERLIYAHGAEEGAPPHFHVTVIFEALGPNRTRVRMHSVFPSKAARDLVVARHNAVEGGRQHMANLAAYLEQLSK